MGRAAPRTVIGSEDHSKKTTAVAVAFEGQGCSLEGKEISEIIYLKDSAS